MSLIQKKCNIKLLNIKVKTEISSITKMFFFITKHVDSSYTQKKNVNTIQKIQIKLNG